MTPALEAFILQVEKMSAFLGRLLKTRIPLTILTSRTRAFCSIGGKPTPEATEAKRLADQARASQNLWDFMVPERNMGVTHPFFLVLLVLTLSLHFYNNHRDAEEDEILRKKRLARGSKSESSS